MQQVESLFWLLVLSILACCSLGIPTPAVDDETVQASSQIDLDRVDELGWTDAHFIAYGWWPNRDGLSEKAKLDIVERLDEIASDDFLCLQNDFGQTALHLAVRQDFQALIQLYSKRMICLNIPNKDGDTPLHYAAFWGRPEAATLLLEAGANPELTNKNGNQPLEDALSQKHADVVRILKEHERTCKPQT